MATRNGVDIIESTVTVEPSKGGAYCVVSTVKTLEYDGCSMAFADFLAAELRDKGVTYPKITEEEVK